MDGREFQHFYNLVGYLRHLHIQDEIFQQEVHEHNEKENQDVSSSKCQEIVVGGLLPSSHQLGEDDHRQDIGWGEKRLRLSLKHDDYQLATKGPEWVFIGPSHGVRGTEPILWRDNLCTTNHASYKHLDSILTNFFAHCSLLVPHTTIRGGAANCTHFRNETGTQRA